MLPIARWALLSGLAITGFAQSGPSFDCGKASSPDEKLICSDPELSRLDRELAGAYRKKLTTGSPELQQQVRQSQIQWLRSRGAGCTADRASCLAKSYQQRLAELQSPSAPGGMTFTIHPSLPPFRFEVEPGREIRVFRGGAPSQTLSLAGSETDPLLYHGIEYFWAVDMNFDGYQDLQLLTHMAANGNTGSRYWLFDPASGKFAPEEQLSKLTSAVADPDTKRILTHRKGGAAVYEDADYQWDNGKLTLVREIRDDGVTRTVRELRNGKLVETERFDIGRSGVRK